MSQFEIQGGIQADWKGENLFPSLVPLPGRPFWSQCGYLCGFQGLCCDCWPW
jgi:hypothetical protein